MTTEKNAEDKIAELEKQLEEAKATEAKEKAEAKDATADRKAAEEELNKATGAEPEPAKPKKSRKNVDKMLAEKRGTFATGVQELMRDLIHNKNKE